MSEQGYPSPAAPERCLNTPEPQRTGSCKTPIQILFEHGVVSGDLPVFVMEKAEGEAHQPSFVFSVTIGGVKCTGQGSSKKAAKQQAAEAALKLLNIDTESGVVPGRSNTNGVVAEPNNPVGLLQTLALQKRWRVPEYIILTEMGPPHRKEFTIICRLESLTEQGVGSTKKAAKKEAAEKMLAKIQSLSGSSEITWTPNPSVGFENIRNSTAEKISLLRRNPLSIPNTDYIQMLLDLSKEQGFEVTYFDIDELTVNGQYQCLAELSTSPVTVCHGTGISCSNAHNDAAHSALQYMKIMATSK
ncbi:PREDICTED: interferon-inducible double-stranded RNA-dependent protein kinase activator A [Cyprinodon variegatus]|uniref:Protein kinase, interferon-inducible double stranded RNA dependent activator n=1 Tax=Cyprinodon variegatus TaxID=28743 RepID=A0A3Q2CAB7_CYPVA|nr:PREDICTED: interferon-inducible double-stranded RNA-dependent protein kinase activator A [Cyprinodon variegatus]XP_015225998.1 PREDICTED: interferon-inducible double-stranded RNA-dependent protein kinase activator A [Cyprinodon variegatus]XP_015225999.1 PREDICTED: interferon-inducible double-stranded RNA-dependent protein kinase activator A [Cyprinodon variegatus]XP_015226000.1 PREDICTED: interferon-inducible double-stranded RNA-dependent protein kinase activator A [Cyprinodon variegatus]